MGRMMSFQALTAQQQASDVLNFPVWLRHQAASAESNLASLSKFRQCLADVTQNSCAISPEVANAVLQVIFRDQQGGNRVPNL
jgi:hypothetical protein